MKVARIPGRWEALLDLHLSLADIDAVDRHRLAVGQRIARCHSDSGGSGEVEREYLVRLRGRPGPEVIRSLRDGIVLEDGAARFDYIRSDAAGQGSHSSFRVILHEGRNREVRRLWEAAGFEVSRLLRVRYGPVELPRDMRPGSVRRADGATLERLRSAARQA